MNNQVVAKIRKIRKEKGITQLQMAERLNIDASAYARLETGVTLTWAKYLDDILSIFDLTPEKFFEGIGSNITITNQQGSYGGNANVEHLHAENKEANIKLIETLERENAHLKSEIDFLRSLLEKINFK
jgi:transcriptional regulator with XRE-family HTH domain